MVQQIIDHFPADLQAVDSTNFQLKICLEPCAIAFLLQATDSTLQAAEYFTWMPQDNKETVKIITFLKQKSKLFNVNQLKTTVYFRTENVMFLPNELIANARLLLQVQFGFQSGEGCLQKNINNDMVVAWKINSVWAELFTEQFPGHACQSSLGNLYTSVISNNSDIIYLTFGNGLVEIVVIFKQNLKLVKCIAYETIDDLQYHLLNICRQLKVEPNEVQLNIQGFVEKRATLYRSLQTFFVDVQTINADNSNWPEALKTLPAHYFTGLIQAK